ncbi:MAG: U32 family peptidase [Lachnospira sp.]|nr:U32 family peptidase [Lachnospira sp.]
MMNNNVEILAPAGSYENFIAAVNAGADAIYLGGDMFGARAYADNFSTEKIIEAISYAHLHNKKVYLTVNTLLKNKEIKDSLYNYILPLYEALLDAVIVQDMGVFSFIKNSFPGLEIHASTQMTLTGKYGAKLLKDMGASRIVTSRELSLSEIREIYENVDIEIESFVHGALCYSYSGQCLFSSMIGGRSGNRGRCAQPCRLQYSLNKEKGYFLSPKDICTLEILPDIIEAGVYSLKIEGRMKSAEYTALVTAMYRKYVDMYLQNGRDGYKVDKEDIEKLMDIFNRGNFTKGYYTEHNGRNMISVDRPNHRGVKAAKLISVNGNIAKIKTIKSLNALDVLELSNDFNYTLKNDIKEGTLIEVRLPKDAKVANKDIYRIRNNKLIEDIKASIISKTSKISINGCLTAIPNEKLRLEIFLGNITVTKEGDEVSQALNQAATKESLLKQIKKTGNTIFEFDKLDVVMGDNIFVQNQVLNALRREALEELEALLNNKKRYAKANEYEPKISKNEVSKKGCSVLLLEPKMIPVVLEYDFVNRIYIESEKLEKESFADLLKQSHSKDVELYIALPYILRTNAYMELEALIALGSDGFLVRNYEELGYLKKLDNVTIICDTTMHIMNDITMDAFSNEGVNAFTYSLELNANELKHIKTPAELIVYSNIPVMISAQCINKTYNGCDTKEKILLLNDRYNKNFKVRNVCKYCYNIIYNSVPMQIYDKADKIKNINYSALRYDFVFENEQQIRSVLSGKCVDEYTRGHFERGVE